MTKKYSYRETVVDEAARVARQLRQSDKGEKVLVRICTIDTIQWMFGGVDGPIRHESNYRTNMAMVWLA